MDLTLLHAAEAAGIGLIAGVIGGLAGIGGSLIMLPGLGFIFGYSGPDKASHHLYMASAMMVNVLVSAPAAWRHAKAGSVPYGLVGVILPVMALAMLAGVLLSDRIQGDTLVLLLAGFIAVYAGMNLFRVARRVPEPPASAPTPGRPLLAGIGAVTGLIGGLLGIGGGLVMVPMLQVLARTPLRLAIGASASVMVFTATVGSALKVYGLPGHGQEIADAFILAVAMGPTAILGSLVGSRLTHALPLRVVRVVIATLLLAASARMAYSVWAANRGEPPAPVAAPAQGP